MLIIGRGGAARRRATQGGAARPSADPRVFGHWSSSAMVAPPSTRRGCLPPVAARAGGGGEISCSAEREHASRPLSLPGPRCRAVVVHTHTRRNRRRRATRSRRPDCPRRVCVANQGETHSWTVPTGGKGDSREGTAGTRGAGLVFEKSGMALPATLSLTCAPRQAYGGRAAVARLPKS